MLTVKHHPLGRGAEALLPHERASLEAQGINPSGYAVFHANIILDASNPPGILKNVPGQPDMVMFHMIAFMEAEFLRVSPIMGADGQLPKFPLDGMLAQTFVRVVAPFGALSQAGRRHFLAAIEKANLDWWEGWELELVKLCDADVVSPGWSNETIQAWWTRKDQLEPRRPAIIRTAPESYLWFTVSGHCQAEKTMDLDAFRGFNESALRDIIRSCPVVSFPVDGRMWECGPRLATIEPDRGEHELSGTDTPASVPTPGCDS